MKWLVVVFFLLTVGVVEAIPVVTIDSPPNATLFNQSINISVSADETIAEWNYSLDSATNVTFTPNITLFIGEQGMHILDITANNGTDYTTERIVFTLAFVHVQVFDIESRVNVSDGVNTRILSDEDVVLASNTTNISGGNVYENFGGFDTYKVQAGGPAGSLYPHIYTYTFVFSEPITNLPVFLPESTACQFITYQYIDSFYSTSLDAVSVTIIQGGDTLTEITSDTNGFITVCLVPGLSYILQSIKEDYVPQNFTDNAAVTSQFIQMVRETLPTVTETSIDVHLYPEETTFFENDTLFFGMWIHDSSSSLVEYKIVYGRDPDIVKDESIAANQPDFKQLVASGTNSDGEYLTCIETGQCLRINDWEGGGVVYVGYFYQKSGEEGVWTIREILISNDLTEQSFWANWTALNNPKENVHALLASVGYGPEKDSDKIPLAWINLSLMLMVFSAIGAARGGQGIMGAMVSFLGMNILLVLLGLIQWWTILVSVALVIFLGNKFGGIFT
jgi:hypothetical protein